MSSVSSFSHRSAGSSHGGRESETACDRSDPGRYGMSYEYPDKMSAHILRWAAVIVGIPYFGPKILTIGACSLSQV